MLSRNQCSDGLEVVPLHRTKGRCAPGLHNSRRTVYLEHLDARAQLLPISLPIAVDDTLGTGIDAPEYRITLLLIAENHSHVLKGLSEKC